MQLVHDVGLVEQVLQGELQEKHSPLLLKVPSGHLALQEPANKKRPGLHDTQMKGLTQSAHVSGQLEQLLPLLYVPVGQDSEHLPADVSQT